MEKPTPAGSIFVNGALIILVGGAGLAKGGQPWFSFERESQRGKGAGRVGGLEDNRMKKGAVTAHPAIRTKGSGNLRRNRVHQESLKRKA